MAGSSVEDMSSFFVSDVCGFKGVEGGGRYLKFGRVRLRRGPNLRVGLRKYPPFIG